MESSEEIDDSTSRFLARPPIDKPDVLLTNFLRSGEIVIGTQEKSPQQQLKDIVNDKRWTRRMVEDWFKQGTPSRQFSITPNPEFRAIYLILLSLLEDRGKEAVQVTSTSTTAVKMTEEEKAAQQAKLDENISEYFKPGSTWEKVDMS